MLKTCHDPSANHSSVTLRGWMNQWKWQNKMCSCWICEWIMNNYISLLSTSSFGSKFCVNKHIYFSSIKLFTIDKKNHSHQIDSTSLPRNLNPSFSEKIEINLCKIINKSTEIGGQPSLELNKKYSILEQNPKLDQMIYVPFICMT